MIRRLWSREEGTVFVLTLAFMMLALPLIIGSLGLASVLSIDSRVKTDILKSQYSAIGGADHAIYRLQYEEGYDESVLIAGSDTYTVDINGKEVTVTVELLEDVDPPPPDPSVPSNRIFRVSKEVDPIQSNPGTPTTYTYTATIENLSDEEKNVTQFRDEPPAGLTYIPGSSTGLTTSDPGISGGQLQWNLTSEEGRIPPESSKVLQFQMTGSLPIGIYCNDAWVDPLGDKTRSGLTAKIRVVPGDPPKNLCPGTAIQSPKSVDTTVVSAGDTATVTYTLTFASDGTDPVEIYEIIDNLPAGFEYVFGSTEGITTEDPQVKFGDQWRLTWRDDPFVYTVAPGETAVLTFKATTPQSVGSAYNEATSKVSGLNYQLFTWPSALVQLVAPVRITATDGGNTVTVDLWLGFDPPLIDNWVITR